MKKAMKTVAMVLLKPVYNLKIISNEIIEYNDP